MSNLGIQQTPETKLAISRGNQKIDKKTLDITYQSYLKELKDNPELCPSLAGLARRYGVTHTTIKNNSHIPEVAEIIDQINTLQEEYLITNGITGKASPSFAQFLLKSKHSYSDDKPSLTQNNFMQISPDILADAMKLMQKSPTK